MTASARLSPIPRRPAACVVFLQGGRHAGYQFHRALARHDQARAGNRLAVCHSRNGLQGERHTANRLGLDSDIEHAVHYDFRHRERFVKWKLDFLRRHSNSQQSHDGSVTQPPASAPSQIVERFGPNWGLLRVARGHAQVLQPDQRQVAVGVRHQRHAAPDTGWHPRSAA